MKSRFFFSFLVLIATFIASASVRAHGGAFLQGQCGQTLRESVILTEDIGPCPGPGLIVKKHGVTVDGNGHEIAGAGNGDGVILENVKNVTIKNLAVTGFLNGIYLKRGSLNTIEGNSLNANSVGLMIASTNATVRNNMIFDNKTGICAATSKNAVFYNILINNKHQVEDVGGNSWESGGLGNYWGNYWGMDDGSDGRAAGDFVGDTLIPHEGVDFYPLLDPSIPEQFGSLFCADWWTGWFIWTGGWSPIKINVNLTDPLGRLISRNENLIGKNAFYIEDEQGDPKSHLIRVLISRPCGAPVEGVYSFEMEGLDDINYSMTSFVSQRGEQVFNKAVLEGFLSEGDKQNIDTRLVEYIEPDGQISALVHLVVPIDIKPDSYPNSINIASAGVIPVSIFSSPTFDAATTNPDTITLEGAGVKLHGFGSQELCHGEDVNEDNLIDLVCHIQTEALDIVVGQSIAVLEGITFDGTLIRGEDSIQIVPK